MARITWQNVAAPDFSDAARSTVLAGESFARAGQGLGDAFKDWHGIQARNASNAVQEKLSGVSSVAEFDALMDSGLGIKPGLMDENLRSMLEKQRAYLIDNQTAIDTNSRANELQPGRVKELDLANVSQDINNQDAALSLGNRVYNNPNVRNDFDLARGATDRGEEDRLRSEEALKVGDQLARKYEDPVKAREVAQATIKDPKLLTEVLANIDGKAPEYFAATVESNEASTAIPDLSEVGWQLDEVRAQDQLNYSTSKELRLYKSALDSFGEEGLADPMGTVIERMRSPDMTDEEQSAFKASAGKLRNEYVKLENKYGDRVPPEVIALVMENNLKASGWIWQTGGQTIDVSQTEADLARFAKEGEFSKLTGQMTTLKARKTSQDKIEADAEKARVSWAKARDNNDAAGMARAEKKIAEIAAKFNDSIAADNEQDTDTPPPATPAPVNLSSLVPLAPQGGGGQLLTPAPGSSEVAVPSLADMPRARTNNMRLTPPSNTNDIRWMPPQDPSQMVGGLTPKSPDLAAAKQQLETGISAQTGKPLTEQEKIYLELLLMDLGR